MTVEVLKYIALLSMLSDHAAKLFWPGCGALLAFGRLAFPIFACLSGAGLAQTASLKRYLLRLLACALVSEIPFDWLWYGRAADVAGQNVCWTLLCGGLAAASFAAAFRTGRWGRFAAPVCAVACMALAELLRADYGACGAALVFLAYLARRSERPQAWTAAAVLLFDLCVCAGRSAASGFRSFAAQRQHWSLLSVPLLACRVERQRRASTPLWRRYYFYLFYPAHMAVLAALRAVLSI